MGIVATILLWLAGGIVVGLILLMAMLFGFTVGKNSLNPKDGNIALRSEMDKETYHMLLEKGGYQTEPDLLNDALTILNWALDTSIKGRHVASCNYDGSQPLEFNLEALAMLRAKNNPVSYLERCLGLEIENGEDNKNNDSSD